MLPTMTMSMSRKRISPLSSGPPGALRSGEKETSLVQPRSGAPAGNLRLGIGKVSITGFRPY